MDEKRLNETGLPEKEFDSKETIQAVLDEVKKAVTGKDDCIKKAFAAILAGGHILVEDVPGVGKTTLAMAFSKALSLENHRMQFTPDVMPADILGFNMYQKESGTDKQKSTGSVHCYGDAESKRKCRYTAFAGITAGPFYDLYEYGISGT